MPFALKMIFVSKIYFNHLWLENKILFAEILRRFWVWFLGWIIIIFGSKKYFWFKNLFLAGQSSGRGSKWDLYQFLSKSRTPRSCLINFLKFKLKKLIADAYLKNYTIGKFEWNFDFGEKNNQSKNKILTAKKFRTKLRNFWVKLLNPKMKFSNWKIRLKDINLFR